MTRDPPEHDRTPGPAAPDLPLPISDPSDEALDSIEIVELTEVSDLIVIVEHPGPPEVAAPPQPPGPSAPPGPEAPDDFETLFDDPQQIQAELAALRAANHELVRINERLADAVEQRTAEMLASRDAQARFIADVNRQVRGPLDAIIGYSELLTEDLTSLELHDLAHDVEKIRSAGESLLDLLGELIERRRLDGG